MYKARLWVQDMDDRRKLISVVTPCYNEFSTARDCYRTVREIFAKHLPGYDYEHVFCDNGSTDGTDGVLRELAEQDSRVKVILNSRNFGPARSTFNGILRTSGDAVFVFLPADMQDPPELIPDFVRKWEEGYKVVYGIRKSRQENCILVGVRKLYYRIVSKLADVNILPDVGDFQLVDRAVVEALRKFDDYNPYLRGMIVQCGFPSTGIPYTWRARKKGFSKSNLAHLIDTGLNGILSFSKLPMRLCMFSGITVAALSMLYALVGLVVGLIRHPSEAPQGIQTVIVALFFFSGFQLFFMGVLGEYIAAIFYQVRKRPLVVEKETINFCGQKLAPRTAEPEPVAAGDELAA
jgi:glycosyltransferase involved in cell wall biosynthesis